MEFNKISRGPKRAQNNEEALYQVLDASFICHVAFQHEGRAMIIPTAYGREGDKIYLHGSSKNFMLNAITNGQTSCIAVTCLDGIVMARTLFDSSLNYRSAVLYGKAVLIEDKDEKLKALKTITDNIISGRWNEVPVGTESQLAGTMLVKFTIESASVKIRAGSPEGDENETNEVWSGHIPLVLKTEEPVPDPKFRQDFKMTESISGFWEKNR